MKNNNLKWAFFGTSDFAAVILEELKRENIAPDLIVTVPDQRQGRKMELKPPPTKTWAAANKIPILQPEKLKDEDFMAALKEKNFDLFIVAAYGKIIPKTILDIPRLGAFNIHPSLLPKYRGPSPLQYQILNDERNLGTTIIKIDEEVDHGPIAVQEKITVENWPVSFKELEKITVIESAKILVGFLRSFSENQNASKLTPQDHTKATFTKMLNKEMGLLDLKDNPRQNYLKYLAFEEWPGTYFFAEKGAKRVRLKIRAADFEASPPTFKIRRVIPEGKKEMSYEDFLKGF